MSSKQTKLDSFESETDTDSDAVEDFTDQEDSPMDVTGNFEVDSQRESRHPPPPEEWVERTDKMKCLPIPGDDGEVTRFGACGLREYIPQSIQDLPEKLPESEVPHITHPDKRILDDRHRPGYCDHCGIRHPGLRPLEKGSIERRNGPPEPCDDDEIDTPEPCECCRCPECGIKSIYKRETKEPPYRCRGDECRAEFTKSRMKIDKEDSRRFLLWECRRCHRPTRTDFRGIPDKYLLVAGPNELPVARLMRDSRLKVYPKEGAEQYVGPPDT